MSKLATESGATWGAWTVRRHFGATGWSDAGEMAAVQSLSGALAGARILDVGVGAGRTSTFLAPPSASYIGIDSSPGMIRLARQNHPGLDLRVGDARALTGIPDETCDIVVFSFNGIDAVAPADRHKVIAEAHRVLVRGGHYLVSMLNLNESEPADRPVLGEILRPPRRPGWRRVAVPVKNAVEVLASLYNYRRTAPRSKTGPGWAWRPMREHEFRFLVQFTRFDLAVASLRDAGFDVERAWSSLGDPLDVEAAHQNVGYSHFVAVRRP